MHCYHKTVNYAHPYIVTIKMVTMTMAWLMPVAVFTVELSSHSFNMTFHSQLEVRQTQTHASSPEGFHSVGVGTLKMYNHVLHECCCRSYGSRIQQSGPCVLGDITQQVDALVHYLASEDQVGMSNQKNIIPTVFISIKD